MAAARAGPRGLRFLRAWKFKIPSREPPCASEKHQLKAFQEEPGKIQEVFIAKRVLRILGDEPGLISHFLEGSACWKVQLDASGLHLAMAVLANMHIPFHPSLF